MTILTSFKVAGDPHDLLAAGTDLFGGIARAGDNGNLAQIVVDEGDGIRIFDLWEREDATRRVPPQQERRQWDVLVHELNPRRA
jgi:hypothetical protein